MRHLRRQWLALLIGAACLAGVSQISNAATVPDTSRAGARQVAIGLTAPAATPRDGDRSSGQRRSRPPERTPQKRLRHLEQRYEVLAPRVGRLARSGRQMVRWFGCVDSIGLDRAGSRQSSWGFLYDERDGTGIDRRTALVRHRDSSSLPRWKLLTMSRAKGCLSRPTDPNGTGDDARTSPSDDVGPSADEHARHHQSTRLTLRQRAQQLARQTERLKEALALAADRFGRFDNWESCIVWLPVTEAGAQGQDLGYLVEGDDSLRHLPAIDIDHGEWDDPDYELLALRGRAKPFQGRFCGRGPGEDVDRQAPATVSPTQRAGTPTPAADQKSRPTVAELLDEAGESLSEYPEDIEDQNKEALEFTYFDQCMYTIGVSEYGSPARGTGYRYRNHRGATGLRPALSFDIRGFDAPDFDAMVSPGEEPPQIECNEDAGGQETDE